MSGFAVVASTSSAVAPDDPNYAAFRCATAQFKHLGQPAQEAAGRHCAAAKFDTASSLHPGLARDAATGSWLMAAGTVMDAEHMPADGNLSGLLARYLQQGRAALTTLDGPFALVVYDGRSGTLAVVTDPFGFISVFAGQRGGRLYIGTSALAVAQAVRAAPSEFGVTLFLTTGNVYGPTTLWDGVERLPAATVTEITDAGQRRDRYWTLEPHADIQRLSLERTVEQSLEVLGALTQRYLAREGKLWADLTGGFDSRLVTLMLHHCGLPFKANCQGPHSSADVRLSSAVARQMGWEYHHFLLPDDWGRRRAAALPRAAGKGDGHLDVFKLSRVLWDQDQRAREYPAPVWGLGGELWRGTIWKQEYLSVGWTSRVHYDRLVDFRLMRPVTRAVFRDPARLETVRQQLMEQLRSVGERQPDLPNTFKLDTLFTYKTTGHTGSHITAVMGLQRAVAPLFFKGSIDFVASAHYRWRQHSRLVRLMLERLSPAVARLETTAGGPALPMRASNLPVFVPYWYRIGKQLVRKVSARRLGRSLLAEARSELAGYPLARWRRETLDDLKTEGVLDHAQMRSAALYDPARLAEFVRQARSDDFGEETLLSRIVTVELALRAVGAALK